MEEVTRNEWVTSTGANDTRSDLSDVVVAVGLADSSPLHKKDKRAREHGQQHDISGPGVN